MQGDSRVVFFDLGHTLVTAGEEPARRTLGARLGLSEKETRCAGRVLMTCPATAPEPLAKALSAALPRRDPARVAREVRRLWDEQQQAVREIPGALAVVERLRAKGRRLGLISNTWHPVYQGFCRVCPQHDALFNPLVLSYRVGVKKPQPELFRHAANLLGENASSCWMVGDSLELDVEPAHRAGMKTVWVLTRPDREKPFLVKLLRGGLPFPDGVAVDLAEAAALVSAPWPVAGAARW
jgi:HAD superfamily hydrolase (TIGR01509 family)